MRLEACDIRAGYDARDVLNGLDIQLNTGELVGLIGPNGSGKSTLLRVLSGVLPPRSGTVSIDGATLRELGPRETALRIAFVPQSEPAAFEFSVRDVVLMGRFPHHSRLRGEREDDFRIAAQALEEVDALHLAARPITELSGGEHRRVLLARALAQSTPLIFLDEPTAHLDITHQVTLLSLLKRLTRERGVGAIAALHDLNQAAEFCDRLDLLTDGRVKVSGAPSDVLTADNLRTAYGARARVAVNPATGRPAILEVRTDVSDSLSNARTAHVICGGGSGVPAMGLLLRHGYRVTAGPLNQYDTDQEAAAALGVETVIEAPYSAIGTKAVSAASAMIAAADVVIVAAAPIGAGNLANLDLALSALKSGKLLVLLDPEGVATRDFTEGEAAKRYEQLISGGAEGLTRLDDWSELAAPRDGTTPRQT